MEERLMKLLSIWELKETMESSFDGRQAALKHKTAKVRYSASLNKLKVEPPQNHGNYSKDTSQKTATRTSHDTLILSETQFLPSTDASPLDFKRQEV